MNLGPTEATIEEIADKLNISTEKVDSILFKLERYFKHPEILDNENMLIKAYIDVYKKEGQEAARKEVARRISAAKEIRKLKKMTRE